MKEEKKHIFLFRHSEKAQGFLEHFCKQQHLASYLLVQISGEETLRILTLRDFKYSPEPDTSVARTSALPPKRDAIASPPPS